MNLHLFVKILYFPQNKSLFCLISIFSAKFSHLFTKLLHYFSHLFRKCFHFSRPFRILFAREKLKNFRERTKCENKAKFSRNDFYFSLETLVITDILKSRFFITQLWTCLQHLRRNLYLLQAHWLLNRLLQPSYFWKWNLNNYLKENCTKTSQNLKA